MPVKPENRARYPSNWAEIVAQVRERSGNACEGSPDFPECRRPNGWLLNKRTGELTDDGHAAEAWELADGDKVVKIVLTTAHLDHQPENCDMANLRHWCQRCHLHYDRHHHQANSQHTRRSRLAVGDLFLGAPAWTLALSKSQRGRGRLTSMPAQCQRTQPCKAGEKSATYFSPPSPALGRQRNTRRLSPRSQTSLAVFHKPT